MLYGVRRLDRESVKCIIGEIVFDKLCALQVMLVHDSKHLYAEGYLILGSGTLGPYTTTREEVEHIDEHDWDAFSGLRFQALMENVVDKYVRKEVLAVNEIVWYVLDEAKRFLSPKEEEDQR